MCDCANQGGSSMRINSDGTVQVLNHSDCGGITVDLLDMFLHVIQCTKDTNRLEMAGITETDADSTILLLGDWISKKIEDPGTCEYQEKLPVVQEIIQKAIITGIC